MTALELLKELHNHDIRVRYVGNELKVLALKGNVTPEILVQLVVHKAALLAHLAEQAAQPVEIEQAQSKEVPPADDLAQSEEAPPEHDLVQPEEASTEEAPPEHDLVQPEESSIEVQLEDDQVQPEEAPSEATISMECSACGAEVEYYSEQGIAYCQTHWDAHLQSLITPWLVEQAPEEPSPAQVGVRGGVERGGGLELTLTPEEPNPAQVGVRGGVERGGGLELTLTPTEQNLAQMLAMADGTVAGQSVLAEHLTLPEQGKPKAPTPLPAAPYPYCGAGLEPGTITSVQALEPGTITSVREIHALGAQWGQTPPARLVLDLETTGLNPRTDKVITLAIGIPGDVTIIDLRGYYRASSIQQQAWREALQQLLQRDAILWIGHNLKFDWSFLAQQFAVRLTRVYDTMLVEKLLHVGERVRASLQASAARYGIEVSKEARSWFIELDTRPSEWDAALPEAQLAYMRQDIAVPYQLYERQLGAIERQDLARVASLEQQALPAIAAIEVHGVCVDRERWRDMLASGRKQQEALEKQIKPILGQAQVRTHSAQASLFGELGAPEINLGSSQQVMQALYRLGIRPQAFSKEALQAVQHLHNVVPLLLEWKALEKFESSFGANLLSYVTDEGRIHATFDQLGAASGRVVCREPNLQQIPKPAGKDDPYDLRRCFVAPQGHRFLIADLSNIELRILAEVSGDSIMQRFFAEGKDLHSETARLMFNLPPEVDPREHQVNGKKARDIAKTINFGLAYGMGAQGLASRVGVDLASAKELMQTYLTTYKGVSAYLKRSGKEGVTSGYATSLSGRKRFFAPDELKAHRDEVERSAKNHPIQGTNADILKCALALLYRRLPPEVHIVLIIHDEIVLECPCEWVTDATQILQDALMQACRVYLKVVHIPATEVLEAAYWRKD